MTAGAPVPQSFKQYLESAARKGYWADTFLLRALASRIGHPLIVWKWVPGSGTWTRGVVAPWFKDEYAQGSRKAKPICLVLYKDHFQALVHEAKEEPPPSLDSGDKTARACQLERCRAQKCAK